MIKECSNCDHHISFFGHVVGCKLGLKPENFGGWGCNKHDVVKLQGGGGVS